MNRLFLGALGLLVVLATTAYGHDGMSMGSMKSMKKMEPKEADEDAEGIILEDYKEYKAGNRAEKYSLSEDEKIELGKLLRKSVAKKLDFIKESASFLYQKEFKNSDKYQNNVQFKFKEGGSESEMFKTQFKNLVKNLLKLKLGDVDESQTVSKQFDQIKSFAVSAEKLKDLEDDKEFKAILRSQTANLFYAIAVFKNKFTKNMQPDDHPIDKEDKTPAWSKEKWDEVYKSLPNIQKYFANGLSPISKHRLAKALKIQDDNYDKKKSTSAMHIDHIAVQARLEAIQHSHTAAGEYFADHNDWIKQELEKLKSAHGTDMDSEMKM